MKNTSEHFLPNATGPIPIPMTNDYLFRALLQENNTVLKGLISSLLHLPAEEILSVEIVNPIVLGKAYEDKDFYLDVKVTLNNHTIINLEMQVINEHNWPERSLSLHGHFRIPCTRLYSSRPCQVYPLSGRPTIIKRQPVVSSGLSFCYFCT